MGLRLLSRLGRVRVLLMLGPDVQDRVVRHGSTNLHNLGQGRLGTLLGSAFVIDAGPVCLLGPGELLRCSGRLVVAFAVGHVGATLLVAVGLTAAVEFAWLPATVTRATDVGASDGAIAVLGALTAAMPRRWRPIWLGWWLAIGVAVVVTGTDFTDAGHVVTLLFGMVVATRFGRPRPWTHARLRCWRWRHPSAI